MEWNQSNGFLTAEYQKPPMSTNIIFTLRNGKKRKGCKQYLFEPFLLEFFSCRQPVARSQFGCWLLALTIQSTKLKPHWDFVQVFGMFTKHVWLCNLPFKPQVMVLSPLHQSLQWDLKLRSLFHMTLVDGGKLNTNKQTQTLAERSTAINFSEAETQSSQT